MKVHVEIRENKKIKNSELAIIHIYIDCKKEQLYTSAELIHGHAALQESVYAVMWNYDLDEGLILAQCPKKFLTNKEMRCNEIDMIKNILELNIK